MKRRTGRFEKSLLMAVMIGLLSLSPHAVKAVEIGDVAPDFTLLSTSGKTISLSQFKGKQPVLLEFYVADLGVT